MTTPSARVFAALLLVPLLACARTRDAAPTPAPAAVSPPTAHEAAPPGPVSPDVSALTSSPYQPEHAPAAAQRTSRPSRGGRGTSEVNAARAPARGHGDTEGFYGGYRAQLEAPVEPAASPSTFSIDVDTASYTIVRGMIERGEHPPAAAVRIEEMVNAFSYEDEAPTDGRPFAVHTEVGACPWNAEHALMRVALKARTLERGVPARNLVLLVDVSGSMQSEDKLPLVRRAMEGLTEELRDVDRVAIVVYAGSEGVALPPTRGSDRARIHAALRSLEAGGSTNGGAGIELAYRLARQSFIRGGVNRVILATDGDFNVGVTSRADLVRLIERERDGGVYLTVLGVGTGNLRDDQMEAIADHGNGNYAYLDSLGEAHRVLVREASQTLVAVARDVKVQVEMNPARVRSYRLVGYENRALTDAQFHDPAADAGELGAGGSVVALYELELTSPTGFSLLPAARIATVQTRYFDVVRGERGESSTTVANAPLALGETSSDFRFSAAVASFGLHFRQSSYARSASLVLARTLAAGALGHDITGDRRGFIRLVDRAMSFDRDDGAHDERASLEEPYQIPTRSW